MILPRIMAPNYSILNKTVFAYVSQHQMTFSGSRHTRQTTCCKRLAWLGLREARKRGSSHSPQGCAGCGCAAAGSIVVEARGQGWAWLAHNAMGGRDIEGCVRSGLYIEPSALSRHLRRVCLSRG
jgi:hypothetical protein